MKRTIRARNSSAFFGFWPPSFCSQSPRKIIARSGDEADDRHAVDLLLDLDVLPAVVGDLGEIRVRLERVALQIRRQVGEGALVDGLEQIRGIELLDAR